MSMTSFRDKRARQALVVVAALGRAASSAAMVVAGQAGSSPAGPGDHRACAVTTRPGVVSCLALIRSGVRQCSQAAFATNAPPGSGDEPSSLRRA
jgi:hypothetical protein